MAFNINAQIILQAPKNVKAITQSIQNQLQGVTINVGANIPKNVQSQLNNLNNTLTKTGKSNKGVSTSGLQAVNTLNSMGKSAKHAGGAMHMLGKETALTFKRFAAAGIVTATFFRMTQAISEAIPKALEFQREMVRLEQITGKTSKQLGVVTKAVRSLSTQLGVDANELANISKIFAQTGQSIREIQASVRAVARSSLAPTFGEMEQTAEGLVAALNQFNIAASQSEAVLGSLNRVSKKFAVESQDLIAAVRRAGGVFAIAAGDTKKPIEALQEFTAVFTAVRSTTRESAETVATGLRTIFTRLQRRGTIDALKALGINLTDANGKFIGLFESFRTLSRELDTIIQKGDAITLSGITEELGGMRQVGKLIPAIKEFRKAEAALLEAQRGAQEGLGGDVAKGLTPLIKQFELVRERFNELIRGITESGAFKAFAKTAIGLANAFLSVSEALMPLLPALTALSGIKIGAAFSGFASGFFGSFGAGGGIKGTGQGLGNLASGGGKSAAQTSSNTQAIANLNSALGTNTTTLSTNNNNLTTINSTLNGLKGTIDPVKSALVNLTAAINNLRTVIATKPTGGGFIGGGGGRPRGGARPPRGFASGGLVPGTGNRDTVPAMLTPGEFVIRKSAVNSVGTGTLSQINGYNKGGIVVDPTRVGIFSLTPPNPDGSIPAHGNATITNPTALRRLRGEALNKTELTATEADAFINGSLKAQAKALGVDPNLSKSKMAAEVSKLTGIPRTVTASGKLGDALQKTPEAAKGLMGKFKANPKLFRKGALRSGGFQAKGRSEKVTVSGALSTFSPSLQEQMQNRQDLFDEKVQAIIKKQLQGTITDAATLLSEDLLINPIQVPSSAVQQKATAALTSKGSGAINTISGFMLEGIIGALTGAIVGGSNANFDFPTMNAAVRDNLANLFAPNNPGALATLLKADAKKTFSPTLGNASNEDGVTKKVINDINKGNFQGVTFQQFAKGGAATGTDTVPAMLTPGEYVINKSAAQAFGYGNLKNINRYNQGGVVKKGRGNYGVPAAGPGAMQFVGIQDLNNAASNAANGLNNTAVTSQSLSANQAKLARTQQGVRKASEKVGQSLKGLGGGALNAFFGVTTLQAGLEELNREGGNVTMALVNLGFGISMLAPALVSLGPVLTAVQGYFVAATAGVTGFTATLGVASKALIASFMGLSPMMKGAIVGSIGLVGGMISDAIFNANIGVKEESIGESGNVRGRRGVSSATAGTQAGVGGALEGAGLAGGAALLLGANPMVALGSATIGALVKGFFDAAEAADQQRDFTALLRLSDAMDNFSDKFGLFNDNIVASNEAMRGATEATLKLTSELGRQAQEITDFSTPGEPVTREGGRDAFRAKGTTALQSVSQNAIMGEITGFIFNTLTAFGTTGQQASNTISGGASAQTSLGRGAEAVQFEQDLTGGERFLDVVTEMANFFGADRQTSAERRMVAASEGLSVVGRESFSEVDIDEVGKQLEQAAGAAGDFLQQKVEGISTEDLGNLSTDFSEAQQQLKDMGVSISGFEQQIAASQSAAVLKKVTEASRSSSKQQQEMAGAYVALNAKARETGKTVEQVASEMSPQDFIEFAKSAGLVTGNAKAGAMAVRLLALEEKKRLEKEIPEMIIMNEKLARAEAIASAALNDYVSSFTRFSGIVESEASKLSNLMGLLDGSIEALSGPNFNIAERFNPFENIDAASFDELNNAIDRIIERTGGGGSGFEGLKEVVAIQKNLPDVLRDVTMDALSQPQAQTQAEVSNLLREGLKNSLTGEGLDFDNVPPQVLESLESSISGLIGNRQDAAGTTEDELKRLFESEDFEKIMEEFGDATGPVVEALSALDSAITQFEQAQLALIQKQTEFTQKEIDARLRQIDIINKTSDALDKFRPGGGPKNTVERAEQRVLERQQAILGNTGGAAATTNVLAQQAEVERLREENRNIRQNISDAGGPRIGADVDISTRGEFDQGAIEAEQAALLENSQALTAHEQALQELISSTDLLDATMAELGDIEKARMDSRQLAQFEAKRFANVLNERDPIKRAKLMQEQFAGDVAFDKLQSGQALTPQDIAALIDGGLERRLAIGVASGDITEEDAENRRAQFNKFLSEVGLPGMNAALGNPFGGAAMDQLMAATALGGTAQGTTDREKNLIEQAEEIAAAQAEAVRKEGEAQAAAFDIVIENAQAELANFSTAVANAATAVNDAQDEMNEKLAEAQALRESADTTRPEFQDAASQEFAKAAEEEKKRIKERSTQTDSQGLVQGMGEEAFIAREQEKFAQAELDKLVAAGKIDRDAAAIATGDSQGQGFVDNVQALIGALSAIDKLVAEGKVADDPDARKKALDQVLGFEPVDNDSLKTIKDMYSEMTTPGSIFVHDIHAEKLLVEIVKLLGGSEQHLQRAAEAAKAEIAGLKSPTSAGVAGNVRSAASDSIVQQMKDEKAFDAMKPGGSDPASVAAFMKSPEGIAIADSVMNQRPGDGQFLSGFAAQGFEEMLASGQFGGSLESLGPLTPSFDSQAILDDIAETLGIPTGVSNEILKSMSADEVQRASQRFSQPVGPVPVPKLSPEEKRAMDERNKIGIQDPNLLTAENRLDKEFERARNIEDNNRREEARIAGGKGRSPLDQDIFDLQQKSAGHDMTSSMLELMLADLKGEDVSKLTQEDIDRRKFGRLDEATQTKKVVTDALLAAQGGRGEGLAAGRFKQGDIESAVSGIGGTRFGRFLNDKQKLDAEVAIRDQASRMGIVSGRTGDASKSQIQLKALEELDAKTNVKGSRPIDDSLNVRGRRPTGAAQVFGGFNEARALAQAEEDEKELLNRTGLSREDLSKKIAENRRKQAQQGNVGGVGLSAKSVQARVDKLRQLENDFGFQLGKDKEGDSDFIARIRKQRDTLANTPEVQDKLEADRLAEEQKKAEAARIAKEEEAKRNAAMTPDPNAQALAEHRLQEFQAVGETTAMNQAAALAVHPRTPGPLAMGEDLPFQLTDADRSNMVKNLIDSGELTSLRTSFDSLNTDAVPNLVQALSDLNTTLTTGAAGGAATGEEGVNIRSLVDAINSLDQVTVNVAVAPVNVILNTGGLADQLRNVIAAEALKALKDKIGPTIDAEVDRIISNRTAG